MTSPTTSSATNMVLFSGSQDTNALVAGAKWGGATGAAVTVSYSFPWAASGEASFSGASGFGAYSPLNEPSAIHAYGLDAVQQTSARNALMSWSNIANVTFSEVFETPAEVGDIRFAWTSAANGGAWGWSSYPDSYWPLAGDVWISTVGACETNWALGSYNFFLLSTKSGIRWG